ncbi:hypothetical protein LMG28614_03790 [Paraburkholderia ultramafica]|uniref:Uncharacterized protein n=2 Tax=Paraburkholderia ultramafica TaxID=1544867 RepID=A0A6S7CN93_9BURK|nr:hypothetical protein [Paraburkholderia ultramafica]CAB3793905.1 hypothetical protein LMG28614_03790 [Paraburkholderia ultramafica]
MASKSRTHKHATPAMPPSLRALTFSGAAHKPLTQAMLLQAYASLDGFRRGYGSHELLENLSRQLLVAEELCHLRNDAHGWTDIEAARAATAQIATAVKISGAWLMNDFAYAQLCNALGIFDSQLSVASFGDIAKAEARGARALMREEQGAVVSIAAV